MKVIISATLRSFFDRSSEVVVEGNTIEDILKGLTLLYPDAVKGLYEEDGSLREFIRIFADDEDVTDASKHQKPLDGVSKVLLLPLVAGGAPEERLISDERRKAVTLDDKEIERFNKHLLLREISVKGQKRITGRSSNTKGSDNIISNGSGIAVADGQCMIIVEQGRVVEVCAEPGEFTYDTSTEPSIFSGSLGQSIKDSFKTIGKRFTYGGDTGKDQRVYYFNMKELIDNKFGTPSPVPFRVVDSKIGLDLDVSIRCSGVYSYKITDPLLFYTNVCGNVEKDYNRSELDPQLKTEFISALQPGFGRLSDLEIRPNQIIAHTTELENSMNEILSEKWSRLRGLSIVSIAIGSS